MKGMMCNDQKDTKELWDKLGVLAGTVEPTTAVEDVQVVISSKKKEQPVQNRNVPRNEEIIQIDTSSA